MLDLLLFLPGNVGCWYLSIQPSLSVRSSVRTPLCDNRREWVRLKSSGREPHKERTFIPLYGCNGLILPPWSGSRIYAKVKEQLNTPSFKKVWMNERTNGRRINGNSNHKNHVTTGLKALEEASASKYTAAQSVVPSEFAPNSNLATPDSWRALGWFMNTEQSVPGSGLTSNKRAHLAINMSENHSCSSSWSSSSLKIPGWTSKPTRFVRRTNSPERGTPLILEFEEERPFSTTNQRQRSRWWWRISCVLQGAITSSSSFFRSWHALICVSFSFSLSPFLSCIAWGRLFEREREQVTCLIGC